MLSNYCRFLMGSCGLEKRFKSEKRKKKNFEMFRMEPAQTLELSHKFSPFILFVNEKNIVA